MEERRTPYARLRGRSGALSACLVVCALAIPGLAFALTGSGSGLTIVVEPPGSGRVIGPGIYCEDECSYEVGGPVTITAEANPGYLFKGWGRCPAPAGRQCTVTGAGPLTVSAKFVRTPALTVSKDSGLGNLTSSPSGISCLLGCVSTTAAFLQSTNVKLKPAPAKHFHFVEWLGDCTGSGPCEPLMDEDHEVEALFAEDPKWALTLTKVGDGQGVVKSKPSGIVCLYTCTTVESTFYEGETVVLEVPKVGGGSTFEGWYGGGCSGTGTCIVTMTEAMEVVAEFGPTYSEGELVHVEVGP